MPKRQRKRDIKDVWIEYKKTKTEALRNILMENYLHLVRYNAERIHAKLPDEVELDDLMSAGIFGLMDAIDAFDLERGVKFETYCAPRIRGAILDELRSMDWVPRLVRSRAHKLDDASKQLEVELGRSPDQRRARQAPARSPMSEFEKMAKDASAVGLVSLSPQVVRDRHQQGRPRDRRPGRQARRRPGPRDPAQGPQGADHQGPVPRRAADHHPLLLRGDDDEGDRRDAGPLRIAASARCTARILARLKAQMADRKKEFQQAAAV